MINFKVINDNLEKYRLDYLTAKPIPHLAIKNFCDVKKIKEVVNAIGVEGNNSRDYVFAHNKFEKSNYGELHPNLKVLKEELMSEEFGKILKYITNRDVFVDPRNYGGGLHTGLGPARLDMHLDFNYHIDNPNWYRKLNLLFYFSPNWDPKFGGHLKLEDLRDGKKNEVDTTFNTMVIQECSSYSLHGYEMSSTTPKEYRRLSIATYAYENHKNQLEKIRSTDWRPTDGSRRFYNKPLQFAVRVKQVLFGSGTKNNY